MSSIDPSGKGMDFKMFLQDCENMEEKEREKRLQQLPRECYSALLEKALCYCQPPTSFITEKQESLLKAVVYLVADQAAREQNVPSPQTLNKVRDLAGQLWVRVRQPGKLSTEGWLSRISLLENPIEMLCFLRGLERGGRLGELLELDFHVRAQSLAVALAAQSSWAVRALIRGEPVDERQRLLNDYGKVLDFTLHDRAPLLEAFLSDLPVEGQVSLCSRAHFLESCLERGAHQCLRALLKILPEDYLNPVSGGSSMRSSWEGSLQLKNFLSHGEEVGLSCMGALSPKQVRDLLRFFLTETSGYKVHSFLMYALSEGSEESLKWLLASLSPEQLLQSFKDVVKEDKRFVSSYFEGYFGVRSKNRLLFSPLSLEQKVACWLEVEKWDFVPPGILEGFSPGDRGWFLKCREEGREHFEGEHLRPHLSSELASQESHPLRECYLALACPLKEWFSTGEEQLKQDVLNLIQKLPKGDVKERVKGELLAEVLRRGEKERLSPLMELYEGRGELEARLLQNKSGMRQELLQLTFRTRRGDSSASLERKKEMIQLLLNSFSQEGQRKFLFSVSPGALLMPLQLVTLLRRGEWVRQLYQGCGLEGELDALLLREGSYVAYGVEDPSLCLEYLNLVEGEKNQVQLARFLDLLEVTFSHVLNQGAESFKEAFRTILEGLSEEGAKQLLMHKNRDGWRWSDTFVLLPSKQEWKFLKGYLHRKKRKKLCLDGLKGALGEIWEREGSQGVSLGKRVSRTKKELSRLTGDLAEAVGSNSSFRELRLHAYLQGLRQGVTEPIYLQLFKRVVGVFPTFSLPSSSQAWVEQMSEEGLVEQIALFLKQMSGVGAERSWIPTMRGLTPDKLLTIAAVLMLAWEAKIQFKGKAQKEFLSFLEEWVQLRGRRLVCQVGTVVLSLCFGKRRKKELLKTVNDWVDPEKLKGKKGNVNPSLCRYVLKALWKQGVSQRSLKGFENQLFVDWRKGFIRDGVKGKEALNFLLKLAEESALSSDCKEKLLDRVKEKSGVKEALGEMANLLTLMEIGAFDSLEKMGREGKEAQQELSRQVTLQLGKELVGGKEEVFQKVFVQTRDPRAFLHYMNWVDFFRDKKLSFWIREFVSSVLEGKWPQARFELSKGKQMEQLFATRQELLRKWMEPREFGVSELIGMKQKSLELSHEQWLQKRVREQDLPLELFPLLQRFLQSSGEERQKVVKEWGNQEATSLIQVLEKQLIDLCGARKGARALPLLEEIQDLVNGLEEEFESGIFAPFLDELEERVEQLALPPLNEKMRVRLTSEPFNLLMLGTDVPDSCQSVYFGDDFNLGLLAYLLHGWILPLVVQENSQEKMAARAMLRMLWDGSQPVLFLERVYGQKQYGEVIEEAAKKVAGELGLELLAHRKEGESDLRTLFSLGGILDLHEYADSAARDPGLKKGGVFEVEGAKLLFKP